VICGSLIFLPPAQRAAAVRIFGVSTNPNRRKREYKHLLNATYEKARKHLLFSRHLINATNFYFTASRLIWGILHPPSNNPD
jgi:hypothetical protein